MLMPLSLSSSGLLRSAQPCGAVMHLLQCIPPTACLRTSNVQRIQTAAYGAAADLSSSAPQQLPASIPCAAQCGPRAASTGASVACQHGAASPARTPRRGISTGDSVERACFASAANCYSNVNIAFLVICLSRVVHIVVLCFAHCPCIHADRGSSGRFVRVVRSLVLAVLWSKVWLRLCLTA